MPKRQPSLGREPGQLRNYEQSVKRARLFCTKFHELIRRFHPPVSICSHILPIIPMLCSRELFEFASLIHCRASHRSSSKRLPMQHSACPTFMRESHYVANKFPLFRNAFFCPWPMFSNQLDNTVFFHFQQKCCDLAEVTDSVRALYERTGGDDVGIALGYLRPWMRSYRQWTRIVKGEHNWRATPFSYFFRLYLASPGQYARAALQDARKSTRPYPFQTVQTRGPRYQNQGPVKPGNDKFFLPPCRTKAIASPRIRQSCCELLPPEGWIWPSSSCTSGTASIEIALLGKGPAKQSCTTNLLRAKSCAKKKVRDR